MAKSEAAKRAERRRVAEAARQQHRTKEHDTPFQQVANEKGVIAFDVNDLKRPEAVFWATWADVTPFNSSVHFTFAAFAPSVSSQVQDAVVIEVSRERAMLLLTDGDWAAAVLKIERPLTTSPVEPDFSSARIAVFRSSLVVATTIEGEGEMRFYHPSPRSVHQSAVLGRRGAVVVDDVITVCVATDVLQGIVRKMTQLLRPT